ncbi:MAG: MBL fold metallo-hydrolase [Deltaproteobacteria bacterium]|nr:MBL fold metallo-hydrolase [Deltaproteobacteria bacterium]
MSSFYGLRLGTCTTYLIRGTKGYILVDAGNRKKGSLFARRLKKLGIKPEEIHLIIATHVHFDHVGSCLAIKTLTKAKVLTHQAERHLLEKGIVVIPPGIAPTHKLASFLGNRYAGFFKRLFRFPACPVDMEVSGKISLEEFGIEGSVIPTPGHTKGSLSVILKDGKAFVGDLAVNYLPFGIGNYMTPYGEDIPQILDSWETILRIGVKTIYPAHGFPITASRFLAALKKHRSHINV